MGAKARFLVSWTEHAPAGRQAGSRYLGRVVTGDWYLLPQGQSVWDRRFRSQRGGSAPKKEKKKRRKRYMRQAGRTLH